MNIVAVGGRLQGWGKARLAKLSADMHYRDYTHTNSSVHWVAAERVMMKSRKIECKMSDIWTTYKYIEKTAKR